MPFCFAFCIFVFIKTLDDNILRYCYIVLTESLPRITHHENFTTCLLASTGAVSAVRLIRDADGYHIRATLSVSAPARILPTVETARGQVRIFKTLEAAVKVCTDAGIQSVSIG